MTCEYCGRESCQAYATRDGFPVLAGDERTLAEIGCRNATRDRALRAEAEVCALCDDPEALNPWLPEGWAWDAAALRWRGPHDLYLTWDTRLGRNKRGAFCPRRQRDGLVAAMVDAVADVMAAEGL